MMLFIELCPTHPIEQWATEMLPAEFIGLDDVGLSKPRAFQISLQVVLQTEEDCIREHSSSRLQVRINPSRLRRILLPMREFVAIGFEQEVHGFSLPSAVSRTSRLRRARRRAEA